VARPLRGAIWWGGGGASAPPFRERHIHPVNRSTQTPCPKGAPLRAAPSASRKASTPRAQRPD
jgi:hypothetical protein